MFNSKMVLMVMAAVALTQPSFARGFRHASIHGYGGGIHRQGNIHQPIGNGYSFGRPHIIRPGIPSSPGIGNHYGERGINQGEVFPRRRSGEINERNGGGINGRGDAGIQP